MRIVIVDLPEDGRRLSGETILPPGLDADVDELRAPDPVRYELTIADQGTVQSVRGSLATKVEVHCSRCSILCRIDIERSFEVLYSRMGAEAAGGEAELDAKALALDYYDGDAVDGHRLLAEQIMLALPMKLLCDEQCRGLCSQCGVNLNETECDCQRDVDPRLSPLAGIRDQL